MTQDIGGNNAKGGTSREGEPMTNAVCEVTKFPVALEFKRRAVRRCSCQACESYAFVVTCEAVIAAQSFPTSASALLAA